MKHQIKMIGLDLDGTVLTDKKELTPRTIKAIEQAIRAGVIVLVATGRPWMGIPEELRSFPGMRYALTSNGARVIDTETGKVIEECLLSPELAKKTLEICGKYDTLLEVYFDGQDTDSGRRWNGWSVTTRIRICGNTRGKPGYR